MEHVIEVENLNRTYKVVKRNNGIFNFIFSSKFELINAVNDITFNIKKGSLVGFVGPNGSGKSTTIKMLTGILVPTSGTIKVLGNDPFKKRKKNAYNIGVVFGQRSQLWWDLPIGDTFKLLKKIYHISDLDYKKNLDLFNEFLNLNSIWNQPVRQLSLGQRIRAEVAVSILHNPKILFLDEPTIGLDIVAKRQIRQLILKINYEFQTTVILTSHDMKDIEEICKKIILIDKGNIIINSTLSSLKNFSKTLHIIVYFKNPVKKIVLVLPGIKIYAESNGFKWQFVLDKNEVTVGQLINELSKIEEISEMKINEKTVEDIIHDIYKNGVKIGID